MYANFFQYDFRSQDGPNIMYMTEYEFTPIQQYNCNDTQIYIVYFNDIYPNIWSESIIEYNSNYNIDDILDRSSESLSVESSSVTSSTHTTPPPHNDNDVD
jgi:hypothetical protein